MTPLQSAGGGVAPWRYRLTSALLVIAGGASCGLAVGVFLGGPWRWLGPVIGACVGFYDAKWWIR